MSVLNRAAMDDIVARHPQVFERSLWQRSRGLILTLAIALYLVFCGWFFAIGHVVSSANWSIAGAYLADWVSWESRPDIKIGTDGEMRIIFPNNDPLGVNPKPAWLKAEFRSVAATPEAKLVVAVPDATTKPASKFNFMAPASALGTTPDETANAAARTEEVTDRAMIEFSSTTRMDISPNRVIVQHDGETLDIPLDGSSVIRIQHPLPVWARQSRPGEKIVLSLGLSGWADVESDRIRIRKRFLGWANFFFDTNSAFFGKSNSEVYALVRSDEQLKPGTSNLDLAINDILYNPSWQHLDVWTKLLQTIVMAFVGTVLATIISFPLSFIAARNITKNMLVNQLTKRFFDFLRSVDMLIWALFFTRAFGPGPLSGMSAIFFTDTGTLGKLYSEALENIDQKQPEGIKSVGASALHVNRFGVLPQVLPVIISQALYFWESNIRSATIIGAVGAGGIGLKLWEAMRTNSDWENVAYMVILILIVVFIFDNLSNAIRTRLIGRNQ